MIAIQSNVKLQFPPASVGFVRIEIDLIQNKPKEEFYELRILDTCFDFVEEDVNGVLTEVKKILGTAQRFKKYTYADLIALSTALNVDFSDNTKRVESINQIFKNGILAVTQQECLAGISGVSNKGMYFSEAQNWEIVN